MRICTRFLIFFLAGFLALSLVSCSTSHGSYGNTKHHKKPSSKSSSTKKPSTKSEPEKTTTTKPAEKSPDDKGADYKSNPQGNATPPKKTFSDHLGYGFNLGNFAFANNTFQFGIAPNIAYKIADPLVVGFMIKIDYYYFKDNYYAPPLTYSSFGLGPTIFTRYKPLMKVQGATPFMQGIFFQAEYEHASISQPYDEFGNINTNGNKIIGVRRWEDYLYIGAGTATGYPFSTFFSIHYNVLDDIYHSRIPWSYRLGFTWNY